VSPGPRPVSCREGARATKKEQGGSQLTQPTGPLAETSALSDVHVEWPGNRQARVKIRETALTFET
jgi:hypothetical protein